MSDIFRNILKVVFLEILVCSTIIAQKHQYIFQRFYVDQGLKTGPVQCIFQDRQGYLWFLGWGDLQKYDGYNFVSYGGGNAFYSTIYEDKSGIFWIGTYRGLEKFDPTIEKFTYYTPHKSDKQAEWGNHVLSILEDRFGVLWIGTGEGLNIFDRKTNRFNCIYTDSTDQGSLINNVVNVIYEDKKGDLWFGTGNGLDKLNRETNRFIHYFHDPDNHNDFGNWGNSGSWITSIHADNDGIFWLGTFGGLIKFNPEMNTFTRFRHNPRNPNSIVGDKIFSICEDPSGKLWIATADKGVSVFEKVNNNFSHCVYEEDNPFSLSSNYSFFVLSERSGTIWVSTTDGVNKLNRIKQPFVMLHKEEVQQIFNAEDGNFYIVTKKGQQLYKRKTGEFLNINDSGTLIHTDNEGNMWFNKQEGGLYKRNRNGKITKYYSSFGKEFNYYVSKIYKTRDGITWIGTNNYGLYIINPVNQYVTPINKLKFFINIIYEDRYGLLWVGTANGGLYCYSKDRKSVTNYVFDPENPSLISFSTIVDVLETKNGSLWFAGNSGLNKYDRDNDRFINYKLEEPYSGFNVFAILEDGKGNLWISSPIGISRIDVQENSWKTYDASYGLLERPFNPRSKSISQNGEMYFGGLNGLVRFHPDSIIENSFVPPVVITSFKIFNKEYMLDSTISLKKIINLSHSKNYLSFEYAALNYMSPQKNQYAYIMEGFDLNWNYSGSRRYASYPNMAPGRYIFRVKASNNDGIWNEQGTYVIIIISPPWWKTWWAYTMYLVIFFMLLYGIRRYELNRAGLKNKIKMDEAVLREKEETDKMKSRFFANISHEFRTPLTLILGPAEKIIAGTSEDITKDANIIKRNSRRLLQLINQLLDLSKLEAGRLRLEASCSNIVSFVKGVTLSFESLSESKDITLKLISEKEYIELYFDKEKMMKILTNILSNAFKFTPEEGMITVSVSATESNRLEIKIKDSGIGIPAEELPKLFDRFYQVDSSHTREYEGTGIGLALTKELVELHQGSISVKSEQKINNTGTGWTEFTLQFPLGKDHLKEDEIIAEENIIPEVLADNFEPVQNNYETSAAKLSLIKGQENIDNGVHEKTIILVVEDNYDMREYIKDSLSKKEYQVEEAVNGEQGVRKAEKIIPDLIISDLMMPKMDGNQLVSLLKNNEKTSHIPIILLTAKAGQENKLEGLETGADDYLTKPFDIKELQVRIKNLISIRKKLQEKFSRFSQQAAQLDQKGVAREKIQKLSSIDEKFLLKVGDIIEKHISEEEFNIEDFCEELSMSRTQVHRKLKALTGRPTSLYIRSVKLTKAKKMISEKSATISEIAYSLGFSSPAYFTRCFKEEFGVPPSSEAAQL